MVRLERTYIQLMAILILRHVRLNRTDLRSLHQPLLHLRRDARVLLIGILLVRAGEEVRSEHLIEHVGWHFVRAGLRGAYFHERPVDSPDFLLAAFTCVAAGHAFFD